MRRALLGGTFDPPHQAHLVLGEAAYRELEVDVVTFIPAGDPWQKSAWEVSGARHRLAMLELATDGVEYFEIDDLETKRDGPSYTFDTISTYPEDDELWLVLGADAAQGIRTWHRCEDVLARVHLCVAARPGVDVELAEAAAGVPIRWLDMVETSISGTEIRRRVSEGKSARFLVPDPVWRYIEDAGLYR